VASINHSTGANRQDAAAGVCVPLPVNKSNTFAGCRQQNIRVKTRLFSVSEDDGR